ncbi:MAG: SRPBCC family protein [Myxococcota bacterium]
MRSFIKVFPLLGLLLLVVLWALGRALPSRLEVSRTLVVLDEPDVVFGHASDLRRWPDWLVGPDAEVTFSGPGNEAGSRMVLSLEDGQKVIVELVEVRPPSMSGASPMTSGEAARVEYRHWSQARESDSVQGSIAFRPHQEDGTAVRLTEQVHMRGATQRWMAFLFGDLMMGQVLDRELHNLKSFVETGRTHAVTRGARR